jgi:hypothetical protein
MLKAVFGATFTTKKTFLLQHINIWYLGWEALFSPLHSTVSLLPPEGATELQLSKLGLGMRRPSSHIESKECRVYLYHGISKQDHVSRERKMHKEISTAGKNWIWSHETT